LGCWGVAVKKHAWHLPTTRQRTNTSTQYYRFAY
jgi:hypothetical protein